MCAAEWKAAFSTKKAAEDYQIRNFPSKVKPVWYCGACQHWHYSESPKHQHQFQKLKEAVK